MPWRRKVHLGDSFSDTAEHIIFTFGANLVEGGAVLRTITLVNSSLTATRYTVWLTDSSGSTSASSRIFEEEIGGGAEVTVIINGPWTGESLAKVVVQQTVAVDSTIRVTCAEEYQR